MNKKYRPFLVFGLFAVVLIVLAIGYLHSRSIPVIEPRGVVAGEQRHLIDIALLLSAIVVLPVFALTIYIALKYREGSRAKYSPDWDHSNLIEFIWWAIPLTIITILSVITWNSSHALDPYKPLSSKTEPLNIQVIALDWKWLFIYPKQQVASVNLMQIPLDTPVNFQVTSDSVMSSFWIPQLGSQIYAMPGMSTQLHMMATKTGSYLGSPANISGRGFSYMDFQIKVGTEADFDSWIKSIKQNDRALNTVSYDQLAKPSQDIKPFYYSSIQKDLYSAIVNKYASPAGMMPGTFTPQESL